MHITMVKKRLSSGEPCPKCAQVEQLLTERGYIGRIDETVWAIENDDESPGMKLARTHGVDLAPFFIVKDDGNEQTYTSALKLINDLFGKPSPPAGDVAANGFTADDVIGSTPEHTVARVLEHFGSACGIAFSGAEDVVLIDMASRSGYPFSVFTLDTGRLHPQTYRFIDRVRDRYEIEILLMTPDPAELEPFVREKGLYSFYRDGHRECCGIRKVEPLRRALSGYTAWMTGQRKDQSPATRLNVPVMQDDPSFQGVNNGPLTKFNPLADWTLSQVWSYIREHDVPYNELHDSGFVSIGCEPCTRARRPGEHERSARWWWEDETKRECGLHSGKEA